MKTKEKEDNNKKIILTIYNYGFWKGIFIGFLSGIILGAIL